MYHTALSFFLLAVGPVISAYGQADEIQQRWQKRIDEQGIKPLLERGAVFYGYPGGMAFHTAFHRGSTTRYILLKTAPGLPAVRDYLGLDERQVRAISGLQQIKVETIRETQPNTLADPNAEPDEQLVDPDYFQFLSDDQFSRLDALALWFDGYSILSRSSVAERLELSPTTRASIARILFENREEIFIPRVRANFAGPLRSDHKYANSEFAGKFSAHLNHEILNVLTPKEAKRVVQWLGLAPPPDEAIKAIQRAAPLPDGLDTLAARWDPLGQMKKAE